MKNVVLITIDCLRADHMSCYGYKRKTTPFLDGLAKKGLFCKNAFANGPNTRHSVPSFLTSTYPLLFLQEAKTGKFHEGRKSIAEILRRHRYMTGAIHSNPYISKFYGYDRGFDYFNDFLVGQVEDEIERNKIIRAMHEGLKGFKAVIMKRLPHEDGQKINDIAFKLAEDMEQPFFLWLHYMDVHMPYVPPNQFLSELGLKKYSHAKKVWMGKKIDDAEMRKQIKEEEIEDYINLYDGCIRYTDWVIKELISKFERDYDNIFFAITADHGEEFREHGDLSHLEKLYDELLHVPLIFYGKDIDAGVIGKPVSLLSLAPTILHFLGIEKDEQMQGKNVFEANNFIIAEAWKDERITAYRDDEWKFIIKGSKVELYNLKEDAEEHHNLHENGKYKEKIKDFKKIISKHVKEQEEERMKRETWLQKEKVKKAMKKIGRI